MSDQTSHHRYLSLLPDDFRHDVSAELIALTKDVSDGLALCLEMLSEDDLRRQNHEMPVLGIIDTTRLMRFAVASALMLRDESVLALDRLDEWAEKRGAE